MDRLCYGFMAAMAGFMALPGAVWAALVVSTAPTANVTCTSSGCAPTAADAVLNVGYLNAALASGDFSLTTSGSGVDTQDIVFAAPVYWYGAATFSLTASNSVVVNKKMSINGYGGLTVVTHTNGGSGRLMFGKRGRIRFAHRGSVANIDGNPYELVANLAELNKSLVVKNNLYTALMDNYDASNDGTYANYAAYGVGQFEGLGNSISNVTITDQKSTQNHSVGLIYYSAIGISNVRLFNVSASSEAKGAYVGGLIGYNSTNLTGDEVSGTVRADYGIAGGIAGYMFGPGAIVAASAHVQVTGQTAGGLVGHDSGAMISQSSATGNVVALKYDGGGLVGYADYSQTNATVDQSFATGSVTGQGTKPGEKRSLGGLVGSGLHLVLTDCYAFGSVVGTKGDIGGFIGSEEGIYAATSYAIGPAGTSAHTGGFLGEFLYRLGYNNGDTNDYWDKTTSGDTRGGGNGPVSNEGITGLNTRQLKAGLPPGFSTAVWAENPMINNGYPYLINNPPH